VFGRPCDLGLRRSWRPRARAESIANSSLTADKPLLVMARLFINVDGDLFPDSDSLWVAMQQKLNAVLSLNEF
jgi:hypothetical protein